MKVESSSDDWFVYMVRCCDGSLYTGISKNVQHRIDQHNLGRGAKYTRSRRPVYLVWSEGGYPDRGSAQRRELEVKQMSKIEREVLLRMKLSKICCGDCDCMACLPWTF